jgi:predicted RNA-binding protein with PUA-like domain
MNDTVTKLTSQGDKVLELIKNYKLHISKTKLVDEVYKWRFLKENKGKPNLNALNFAEEYKSIKFGNLTYQLASAVGNHICREKPEEFRQLFTFLFDEKTDINERVKNFNEDSLIIYRSMGETLGHHQDERTISAYLTLHNPEEYTFFKVSYYKRFCQLMGVSESKKNRKYGHYLELLNVFINSFIISDSELIESVKKLIPDFYDGTNHLLLAQDILYSMLDQEKKQLNYWVFQGNPTKYDFQNAIKEGSLTDWTASAHRDKFKIGDKIIFWLSGKDAGCYALGEINTEPFENDKQPDGNWKEEDHSEWKVGIQITHNLTSNPIFKEVIDATSEFKDLKVGHQGTNFTATKEEYEGLLDIIDSGKSGLYNKIKRSLSSDKLAVFLQILRAFTKQNDLSEEDPRISFNIRESHSRLVFVIGSRYSLCIEKIKKETILSFISEHDISNATEVPFKSKKGEVEAYWNHFNFDKQDEFEKLVFEGLNSELKRNYHCNYKNFSNHEFAVDILGESQVKYWIYAPGDNANMWDEFYSNSLMGLGWDGLGDLNAYKSKDDISKRLIELEEAQSSKSNDASANFDFKVNMSIGDIVIVKKGRNAFLGYGEVISDYYFDDSVDQYKHRRKVNWKKKGLWNSEHKIVLKTLTDITNLPYKPNPSILAYEAILNIMNDTNPEEMNHTPLNQILYGPPGTGKTFTTIDLVVDILEG